MKVTYLPMGSQSFSLKRNKVLYSNEVPDSSLILGYLCVKSLCFQKSTMNADHTVAIGDRAYCYTKQRTKKMKRVLGYLSVKDEQGRVAYIGLCHKRKPLFGFGISALIAMIHFATATTVLAAGALAITTVLVAKEYLVEPTAEAKIESTSTKKPEKLPPQEVTVNEPGTTSDAVKDLVFPDAVGTYDGSQVVNDDLNATTKPDAGNFQAPLYNSFSLTKGESIPLINVPENDVILQYVITDENKNLVLDYALKPNSTWKWIPNVGVGTHKFVMNINVYSLDQKSQFIGRTYDVTINITN